MNFKPKHFLNLILGVAAGSGVGWLASFLIKPGSFPTAESSLGLHWSGLMLGAVGGLALAAITLVIKAGHDPRVGPPRYFIQHHGMGSTLLGHLEPRADGSYVATEWFTIVWIPIFPVCRYRVTEHPHAATSFYKYCTIHEKMPARLDDAVRVYRIILLILSGITGLVCLLAR